MDGYLQQDLSISRISRNPSHIYGVLVAARCLGMYFIAIAIVANFYTRSFVWVVISPLVLGIGGYRLQFILHDTSHHSLFKSKRVNRTLGYLVGLLVGVDYKRYRFTHMWHHRRNGEQADPQIQDYLGSEPINRKQFIWFLFSPLIGSRLFPYLKREMTSRDIDGYDAPKSTTFWWIGFLTVQSALVFAMVSVSNRIEVPIFYYLGLSTTSLFLSRLRTLAEHQQVPPVDNDFSRSHKWNLFDWLFLYDANFNLHFEHHLYPNLQTSELKQVRNALLVSGKIGKEAPASMIQTIRSMYLSMSK
jgi:fatty acid desaturase